MSLTVSILISVLLGLVAVVKLLGRRAKGRPIPGPTGLRCLAAFIQGARKNNLHHIAMEWAEQFGDLVHVKLLGQNVIYINESQLIRRLFNGPNFKEVTNDRCPSFISKYVVYNDKNMAFTSRTKPQQRRRKVFHSALKFYGENVTKFENIFMVSMKFLNEQIEQNETVELTKEISRATLRIVDILLAGENHQYTERHLKALEDFDSSFNKLFIFDNETILQPFPFLRFVPGLALKTNYEALIKARDTLTHIYLQEGKDTFDPDVPKGLVDSLLRTQKKLEAEGDTTMLEDDVIRSFICESTIAGFLTTYQTMSTLFLLMLLQPDIQNKLYAEIKDVIGDDLPSLSHKSQMPYTEAVVLETLRYSTNGPFLLPHYTKEDVNIDGYCIPKHSTLLANVWYSHRRPDKWEDPWSFKPERFLDNDGYCLPADHLTRQNLLAFGIGSRACPGEAFARSRMFLILTSLVQKFEFSALGDETLPSPDPRMWKPGAVLGPGDFRCRARLRI